MYISPSVETKTPGLDLRVRIDIALAFGAAVVFAEPQGRFPWRRFTLVEFVVGAPNFEVEHNGKALRGCVTRCVST